MGRRAVAHEVLNSERFQAELAAVAKKAGKRPTEARKEADIALLALVSVQIPFFGFLYDRGLGPLHTRAWSLDVDWAALTGCRRRMPTNRWFSCRRTARMPTPTYSQSPASDPDAPQLHPRRRQSRVLPGRHDRPARGRRVHSAQFPGRRSLQAGVREYMRYLVASGANLEWYMEGGRSRTGKLRRPRYGLFRYLVEAMDSGAARTSCSFRCRQPMTSCRKWGAGGRGGRRRQGEGGRALARRLRPGAKPKARQSLRAFRGTPLAARGSVRAGTTAARVDAR